MTLPAKSKLVRHKQRWEFLSCWVLADLDTQSLKSSYEHVWMQAHVQSGVKKRLHHSIPQVFSKKQLLVGSKAKDIVTPHTSAHTHTHTISQHASQLQQVEAAQAINLHSLVVHRTVIIQLPAHKTVNQPISTGRGLSKYCSALADRK